MLHSKFSGYRTVAQACDHTDAQGYLDITTWPTLDDCLIGAWDIAASSTRLPYASHGLLVKWVIGQAMVLAEGGIGHWRTIEVIALNYDGSRVVHSASDKSGIAFDFDTPDDLFGPSRCSVTPEPEIADDGIYVPSANGHDWLGALGDTLRGDVASETEINTNVFVNPALWIDQAPYCNPTPRAELTDAQVSELLLQLEHFSAVSYESTDIDVCCNASLFALGIMKILG